MNNTDLKPYTPEETRRMLYAKLDHLAQYWSREKHGKDELDRMRGLIFSILTMFDGGSADWPAMDIRMSPHSQDQAFHEKNGERWHEPQLFINECQLHEEWSAFRSETEPARQNDSAKPLSPEEYSVLNHWPEGTQGHHAEGILIRSLLQLCNQHGFGRVPQLADQIEDLWRNPGKRAEYQKQHEEHSKFMRECQEYHRTGKLPN